MKNHHTALYTLVGILFVGIGLTIFNDTEYLKFGFFGAGVAVLLLSAVSAYLKNNEESE